MKLRYLHEQSREVTPRLFTIAEKIREINNLYGWGDVVEVIFSTDKQDRYCPWPNGIVLRRRQTGWVDAREFYMVGKTLRFLGKKRVLKEVKP